MKIRFGLCVSLLILFSLLLTSCNLPITIDATETEGLAPTILLPATPEVIISPTIDQPTETSNDVVSILSINPPMPAGLSSIDPISVFLNYSLTEEKGTLQIWFEQFTDPECTIVGQSPDGGSTIGGFLMSVDGGSRDISVEIPPIALLNAEYIGVGTRLWKEDESEVLSEDLAYDICYQAKKVPIEAPVAEGPSQLPEMTPIIDLIAGTGSISGIVFDDPNSNGIKDSAESGGGSIEVRLANSSCSGVISSATTDGTGSFSFRDITEGNYCVIMRSTGIYRRVSVTAGNRSYVEIPFTSSRTVEPEPPAAAAGYCGDGLRQADLGEQCDPPNLTDCTASCQSYTGYCGNGIVDPSLGEQCDPPNVTDCTASCQIYIGYCGDGYVDAGLGEQCDPPNTTDCTASCQVYVPSCGNYYVDPGETCDPPNVYDCTASCQTWP